jgi:hypothetical protein
METGQEAAHRRTARTTESKRRGNESQQRNLYSRHVLLPGAQSPVTVRVGGWALTANGKIAKNFEYTGSCPVNLRFDWGLLATAPTEVTYRYKRSDDSEPSATKKVKLAKANTSVDVSDTWDLGANTAEFKDFKGWIKLTTFEPNKVEQKILFTLHCK